MSALQAWADDLTDAQRIEFSTTCLARSRHALAEAIASRDHERIRCERARVSAHEFLHLIVMGGAQGLN